MRPAAETPLAVSRFISWLCGASCRFDALPRPASKIFIGIVATAVLIDEFDRMVHVRASGPSGKLGSLS